MKLVVTTWKEHDVRGKHVHISLYFLRYHKFSSSNPNPILIIIVNSFVCKSHTLESLNVKSRVKMSDQVAQVKSIYSTMNLHSLAPWYDVYAMLLSYPPGGTMAARLLYIWPRSYYH